MRLLEEELRRLTSEYQALESPYYDYGYAPSTGYNVYDPYNSYQGHGASYAPTYADTLLHSYYQSPGLYDLSHLGKVRCHHHEPDPLSISFSVGIRTVQRKCESSSTTVQTTKKKLRPCQTSQRGEEKEEGLSSKTCPIKMPLCACR
jgi:hypothetical protein